MWILLGLFLVLPQVSLAALPFEWHADTHHAEAKPFSLNSVGPSYAPYPDHPPTESDIVTLASVGLPAISASTPQSYVLRGRCESYDDSILNGQASSTATCSGQINVYSSGAGNTTHHPFFRWYFYLPSTGLLTSTCSTEWQKWGMLWSAGGEAKNAGESAWIFLGNYPASTCSPKTHASNNYAIIYNPDVVSPGTAARTVHPTVLTGDAWHYIEVELLQGLTGSDTMRVWIDKDACSASADYETTAAAGSYFSTTSSVYFDKFFLMSNWIGWADSTRPAQTMYFDYMAVHDGSCVGDTVGLLSATMYKGRLGTLFPR